MEYTKLASFQRAPKETEMKVPIMHLKFCYLGLLTRRRDDFLKPEIELRRADLSGATTGEGNPPGGGGGGGTGPGGWTGVTPEVEKEATL